MLATALVAALLLPPEPTVKVDFHVVRVSGETARRAVREVFPAPEPPVCWPPAREPRAVTLDDLSTYLLLEACASDRQGTFGASRTLNLSVKAAKLPAEGTLVVFLGTQTVRKQEVLPPASTQWFYGLSEVRYGKVRAFEEDVILFVSVRK